MIIVDFNFDENKKLGKCVVEYFEDYEDDIGERECYFKLIENAEIYNKISDFIEKNGFPDLHPTNYKDAYKEYPLFMFKKD
ncbi:MAG: hypothetical protein ACPLVF_01940 [Thermovenabulum sp.]|uniref:hypothetical protein n=1 Tax=Thermovenabulum sp. TaxID=3100335 RepID=UPI003C7E5A0E